MSQLAISRSTVFRWLACTSQALLYSFPQTSFHLSFQSWNSPLALFFCIMRILEALSLNGCFNPQTEAKSIVLKFFTISNLLKHKCEIENLFS